VKLDAHLRVLVEQGKPHVNMKTYLRKDGWEKVEPSEVIEETPEDGWTVRKRIAPKYEHRLTFVRVSTSSTERSSLEVVQHAQVSNLCLCYARKLHLLCFFTRSR
jgi:hypothetical protein